MAERDMTQGKLSEKSGIARTWLSMLLSRGTASANAVVKIAKGLNVDPEEIIL